MGREYTRRGGMWLFTAAIAVAGAALWLLRDVRYEEGSLVVNINTATQTELETVPGIGPALAARIIAGRPYASVDDLLPIPGIGENTLESMRPFLKTDGETSLK